VGLFLWPLLGLVPDLDPRLDDPGVGIRPPRTLLFDPFPVPFFFKVLLILVWESSPTDFE
jgi:hypothetical protein